MCGRWLSKLQTLNPADISYTNRRESLISFWSDYSVLKPENVSCSCQISITKIQHKALQSQHTRCQKIHSGDQRRKCRHSSYCLLVIVQLAWWPKDKTNPKMSWHGMWDVQLCNFPCKAHHHSPSSVWAAFPSSHSSLSISERKTGREKDWAWPLW